MPNAASQSLIHRGHCFVLSDTTGIGKSAPQLTVALSDTHAAALATLLPLLGCGEEAAALAFDGLAESHRAIPHISSALRLIADEERIHEALIARLRGALPEAVPDTLLMDRTRRFHIGLRRGGVGCHLARIAALDAAVCTLISRLIKPGRPTAAATAVLLDRILRDEARHVRLSRRLALGLGVSVAMADAAAAARDALADLLGHVANAFEALDVDPAALDRDIRRLPDGLLTA